MGKVRGKSAKMMRIFNLTKKNVILKEEVQYLRGYIAQMNDRFKEVCGLFFEAGADLEDDIRTNGEALQTAFSEAWTEWEEEREAQRKELLATMQPDAISQA